MTRIDLLCFAALAATSLTAANANDLANFRRDIERQLGADFVRDAPLPANVTIAPAAPDCSQCLQSHERTVAAKRQAELRQQYEADQRAHINSAPVAPAQPWRHDTPVTAGAGNHSTAARPESVAPSFQSGAQLVGRDAYGTYALPKPSQPPPSRSGAYIAPYDSTPATPQLQHASPTLSLLPNVGSKQSAGRQVWSVIDGDEDFAEAGSTPYAPTTHHHGLPVSVRVSPLSGQPPRGGHRQNGAGGDMGDLPIGIVQPSIYPPTDAFGNPSLDLRLAASIPANAITASNIDPDRLMQTPVAYHTEGASLSEILRSLVPASYKVSYDIDPGIRDKVYRVTIEKPLAEAIQAIEAMANVHIKPYHKLQVLLVTEHRNALK